MKMISEWTRFAIFDNDYNLMTCTADLSKQTISQGIDFSSALKMQVNQNAILIDYFQNFS